MGKKPTNQSLMRFTFQIQRVSNLGKWVNAEVVISIMHRPSQQGAKPKQVIIQTRLLLLRTSIVTPYKSGVYLNLHEEF